MPTYRVLETLKGTFVDTKYNIRANPGETFETNVFLPDYYPVELIDPSNPPAIVDRTEDIELNPNDEYILQLTPYHKRVQVSLLTQTDDSVYIYLEDEPNYHVILTKELPDYVKNLVYYTLSKIRIKAPNTNIAPVKVRIHLEAK